jgi:hypothetical protein
MARREAISQRGRHPLVQRAGVVVATDRGEILVDVAETVGTVNQCLNTPIAGELADALGRVPLDHRVRDHARGKASRDCSEAR